MENGIPKTIAPALTAEQERELTDTINRRLYGHHPEYATPAGAKPPVRITEGNAYTVLEESKARIYADMAAMFAAGAKEDGTST